MSDWLYQYWFFCFKTAKHWGKGPTAWTVELLDFEGFSLPTRRSLPGTPHQQLQDDAEESEPPPLRETSVIDGLFMHENGRI
jgi:hypothetical protein